MGFAKEISPSATERSAIAFACGIVRRVSFGGSSLGISHLKLRVGRCVSRNVLLSMCLSE